MKTDRLGKSIKALAGSMFNALRRRPEHEFHNPRRYRLDFIAENTFNRVWTLRFSRLRVLIVSSLIVAAIAALVFVIVFYSPVRKLLPGRLEGDLRSRYVDMAMRLDSLEQRSLANDRYVANLRNIMSGAVDSVLFNRQHNRDMSAFNTDSLLAPSEAEREFVQLYEASDRFNLSVLTPIVAEGMSFFSPVPDALSEPVSNENATAVTFSQPDLLPVSTTFRGTVVSVYTDASGLKTVIVQHPNDFISIYGGLTDCFTAPGARVTAGERIGHSGRGNTFRFELWHSGSATDPNDFIGF
ncbi:MAG: M23 family metallopeptidase [Muribaculaceae bacterium]|nr:M23 family metallopeptidase [Muribaculaceae bacterium]